MYERAALIFDTEGHPLGDLSLSLIALGLQPLYATDFDELVLMSREYRAQIGAALLPASLVGAKLPALRKRVLEPLALPASAVVAVGVMSSRQPDWRVLYASLSDKDGGAVIAALSQMNVPHRFTEGGGAIMVPADKVHDARLKLASQGLPRGGAVGFELMENQKFGVTQFQGQYVTDWARVLAFVTLALVPAIGIYLVAERQLIAGLTAGSVKG